MKRLVIIRHASFEMDNPIIDDVNRPISRAGTRQAAQAGEQLADFSFKADLLVSSPALRSRETAQIIAEKLEINSVVQVVDEIYQAERPEILRVVHELPDTAETVLLVGHHPGVSLLLNHLVDCDVNEIEQGGFAVLELDATRWRDVSFKRGEMVEYTAPQASKAHHGIWWQFTFWRRQRIQKVELLMAFVVGLLVILAVVALIVSSSTDHEAMPDQGSGGQMLYSVREP